MRPHHQSDFIDSLMDDGLVSVWHKGLQSEFYPWLLFMAFSACNVRDNFRSRTDTG